MDQAAVAAVTIMVPVVQMLQVKGMLVGLVTWVLGVVVVVEQVEQPHINIFLMPALAYILIFRVNPCLMRLVEEEGRFRSLVKPIQHAV